MLKETVRYIQSPMLVVANHGESVIVYHPLYGNPTHLNQDSWLFLCQYNVPRYAADLFDQYGTAECSRWTRYFLKRKFLLPVGHDERRVFQKQVQHLQKRVLVQGIKSVALVLDEACNLSCSHCISQKLIRAIRGEKQKFRRMSWETARRAVDTVVQTVRANGQTELEVFFGGSEPFLNWAVVERIVAHCREAHPDLTIRYSTNSNAILIDDQRAKFLAGHGVTVTSSLDGLPDGNNRSRVTHNGRGTFSKIINGWDKLGRQGRPVNWFNLTLTDKNIDHLDETFLDFLASRKIATCTFEPDLIVPLGRPPEEVVDLLMSFRHAGHKRGIVIGGLWDKPLKNLFVRRLSDRLFNCSAFTGQGMAVRPSGEIVICAYSMIKIGQIEDIPTLVDSPVFRSLVSSRAVGNIPECKGCSIEGFCIGGCFLTTEYGRAVGTDDAFRYRCAIYRRATELLLAEAVAT